MEAEDKAVKVKLCGGPYDGKVIDVPAGKMVDMAGHYYVPPDRHIESDVQCWQYVKAKTPATNQGDEGSKSSDDATP